MTTKIGSVKNEEMYGDEFRLTMINIEDEAAMDNMPLKVVLDLILSNKPAEYIDQLCGKLRKESITRGPLHHYLEPKRDRAFLGESGSILYGRDRGRCGCAVCYM